MRKTSELIRGSSTYRMSTLQRYCICIIQFLSSHATDPHRYFEQKLTGDVLGSESPDELMALLENLILWVDSMNIASNQITQLEGMKKRQQNILQRHEASFERRSIMNDGCRYSRIGRHSALLAGDA